MVLRRGAANFNCCLLWNLNCFWCVVATISSLGAAILAPTACSCRILLQTVRVGIGGRSASFKLMGGRRPDLVPSHAPQHNTQLNSFLKNTIRYIIYYFKKCHCVAYCVAGDVASYQNQKHGLCFPPWTCFPTVCIYAFWYNFTSRV